MLSIIIPTLNSERFLGISLHSLARQTQKKFEIIIADGGSVDGTLSVLEEMKNKFDITVLNVGRCPIGEARNKAIRSSKYELVSFLDSDDWYFSYRVEKSVNALLENPQYDAVFSDFVHYDVIKNQHWIPNKYCKDQNWQREIFFRSTINLNTLTIRKSFLISNNIFFSSGYRGRFGEDWDFAFKLVSAGCHLLFDPIPSVGVIIRGDSHTDLSKQWKMKFVALRMLTRGRNNYQSSRSYMSRGIRLLFYKTIFALVLSGKKSLAFKLINLTRAGFFDRYVGFLVVIVLARIYGLYPDVLKIMLGLVSNRSPKSVTYYDVDITAQREIQFLKHILTNDT